MRNCEESMESSSSDTVAFDIDPKAKGDDLAGKTVGDFHVLKQLGQGGMGEVYLAEQVSLKRKVALKTMRSEVASKPTALKRFQKEAEAVAKFTHPNIVQIYFIGETEGLKYIVLEFVDGVNLASYVGKKGPVALPLAFSIMKQVASALHHAGEHGIVHRDIKPENILLNRKGEVKITDFGLARSADEDGQPMNLTQTGMIVGTPHYMSPEQVQGKKTDHRTDIYSFGAMCYYMLTGKPPYQGTSIFELAKQHVEGSPKLLNVVRPEVPAELMAVINKMMAKKVDERYQTGLEIVKDLQKLQQRLRDLKLGSGSNITPALSITAMDHTKTEAIPLMSDAKRDSNIGVPYDAKTETIPEPEDNETPPAMPRPSKSSKKKKFKAKKKTKSKPSPLVLMAAAAVILLPMLGVGVYLAVMKGGDTKSASTPKGTGSTQVTPPDTNRIESLKERAWMPATNDDEIVRRDQVRLELALYYLDKQEHEKAPVQEVEDFFQRLLEESTKEIGTKQSSSLALAWAGLGIVASLKNETDRSNTFFGYLAGALNALPFGPIPKLFKNDRFRVYVHQTLERNKGACGAKGEDLPPDVNGLRQRVAKPMNDLPGLPGMP